VLHNSTQTNATIFSRDPKKKCHRLKQRSRDSELDWQESLTENMSPVPPVSTVSWPGAIRTSEFDSSSEEEEVGEEQLTPFQVSWYFFSSFPFAKKCVHQFACKWWHVNKYISIYIIIYILYYIYIYIFTYIYYIYIYTYLYIYNNIYYLYIIIYIFVLMIVF